MRLRREGNASFIFAGEHAMTDPETRAAMQRQVNNCSLADQVRTAIEGKKDKRDERESKDGGAR